MSRIRRRIRGFFTGRRWLEGSLTVLGALFLALSAGCVIALVTLIVNFGDTESGLPIGPNAFAASKGIGLAVFSLGAVITFGVGWMLAGEPIRRQVRRITRRNRERG